MILDTLKKTKLPVRYSHFKREQEPPYLIYIGDGQEGFKADNTIYDKQNNYQIEYYFAKKDEKTEAVIEQTLLDDGYIYEKSDDIFLDDEGIFLIYYHV